MEIKKSPKADLEKDVFLSVLLGLLVSISLVFVSLQWKTASNNGDLVSSNLNIADVDEAMLIQEEQKPEEPEPPKPEQKVEEIQAELPEEFKVVDNDKKVQTIKFVSTDEDKPLPPPPPPAPAEEEEAQQIFEIVEQAPEFPEGDVSKWVGNHMEYPQIAAENGIQGRVIVQFVIERDGSVSQIKVARGVDPSLDKEAMRVVGKMPKWKPGMQRGKPVRFRYTLPVVFRLQ